MNEEWRDCPRLPGYKVSNLGRVEGPSGKILKHWKGDAWGHRQISTSVDGVKGKAYVHTLVLEAFVGPKPEGQECLHGDDDPANNELSNLSWGTHAVNQRSTCKLTEADVEFIRNTKTPATKLAIRFGVHVDVIKRCRRRETYTWLK